MKINGYKGKSHFYTFLNMFVESFSERGPLLPLFFASPLPSLPSAAAAAAAAALSPAASGGCGGGTVGASPAVG